MSTYPEATCFTDVKNTFDPPPSCYPPYNNHECSCVRVCSLNGDTTIGKCGQSFNWIGKIEGDTMYLRRGAVAAGTPGHAQVILIKVYDN